MVYHVLLVLSTACLVGAQQRCNRNEYSCKEGKCISKRFLCDGWQDCQDGADERECVNPCQSNEFRCPNTEICLHESVKCNGDFDCPDGGDELQCDYPLCKADEFQCDNGWCLHSSWMCDGNQDCLSGEDEEQCAKCPSSMFQCAPNSCIPPTLKCNGIKDCENGKDEKGCCSEFECGSGECLRQVQVCDKRVDCSDGSDEGDDVCGPPPCPENNFQCGDGTCIDIERVCDGVLDCRDKRDEKQPSCYQMLIMRKRMRGLYNGFDSYVSKVMTVLNYIPAIQSKQDELEGQIRGVRGELEVVRRKAESAGGQTIVYREGGSSSGGGVSVYIENRIVQLESSMTNLQSDLEFMKAEFNTEKKARSSDSNTLEEVATTVFLQKSDVSKLGREVQEAVTELTGIKYNLETLSNSFASYKQSNYGIADKINGNTVKLEELSNKYYYLETTIQSLETRVSYGSRSRRHLGIGSGDEEELTINSLETKDDEE